MLVWLLRISSTIPVSRTLSGCRTLSYKHACSGALLPSNGERPPCTQWRWAPLPSSEGTGRRSGDQTSWGQRRKASTLGKTGSTDDAVQDRHVGWRLQTGVKKRAAVMGAKGYHLSFSDCVFFLNQYAFTSFTLLLSTHLHKQARARGARYSL